jgi:hypothetical protein
MRNLKEEEKEEENRAYQHLKHENTGETLHFWERFAGQSHQ